MAVTVFQIALQNTLAKRSIAREVAEASAAHGGESRAAKAKRAPTTDQSAERKVQPKK